MQKTLAAIALAATLTGLGTVAAQAAETYPAPAPQSAVSQGRVLAGGTVTFSGSGFTPGEKIFITVSPGAAAGGAGGAGAATRSVPMLIPAVAIETVTTTADTAGAFSVDIVLTNAGVYTLTAVGSVSGVTQTNTVTVTAEQAATVATQGQTLPNTGADAGLLGWSLVGAGALAAGITSVVVVRRRAAEAS